MKQVYVGQYRTPKDRDEYWNPDTYTRRPSVHDSLGLWRIKNRRKRPRIKAKVHTIPVSTLAQKPRYLWGSWRYSTLDEAKKAVVATLQSNSPVQYGELSGWQYCQIGDEVIVWR